MTDRNEPETVASFIQCGLYVVAGVSVACAALHALLPDRFDEKTAMFLALAVVALVIHQVTKFKGFGIEIEKEVQRLKEDVKTVGDTVGQIKDRVSSIQAEFQRRADSAKVSGPLKDLMKSGEGLKTIAQLLDNSDFILEYLKLEAGEARIYAATIAIDREPQAQFFAPLVTLLSRLIANDTLEGIRPNIVWRIIRCIQNVAKGDNELTTRMLGESDRHRAIKVLEQVAKNKACQADPDPRGIIHRAGLALRAIKKKPKTPGGGSGQK